MAQIEGGRTAGVRKIAVHRVCLPGEDRFDDIIGIISVKEEVRVRHHEFVDKKSKENKPEDDAEDLLRPLRTGF